ncbi:MAG: DUF2971 domain-containing protein, partial [Bacteroidetes bacterium]|nr:DUF2971 domain-containing protein [Bacteroidota bacterium]
MKKTTFYLGSVFTIVMLVMQTLSNEAICQDEVEISMDDLIFDPQYYDDLNKALANKEEFVRNWLDATGRTFGETLICSLSANNSNILLWSHYSDSHRGFCIGFDTATTKLSIGLNGLTIRSLYRAPHLFKWEPVPV